MKFIHRLGYYLGGFAIGLVILAFFLNGKDASCDYTPNARTTKFLAKLPKTYSQSSEQFLIDKEIDSITLNNLIRFGDVDFKNSNTKGKPCKTYYIDSKLKEELIRLHVETCDEKVKILNMESNPN